MLSIQYIYWLMTREKYKLLKDYNECSTFSSMKLYQLGIMGMMFSLFLYTRITHGKSTKEHQHKNTFKALMVFILKTNGWINIHFRFCLELIMFSFVFFFIYWNNNTVRYVKFLSWLGLMGRFMREISDNHLAWNAMFMHAKPEMVFYYNKRKL